MIRLTYAHRWTHLADALAAHLAQTRRDNPLQSLTVLTTNSMVGAYLKLALAEGLGIAANLSFAPWRPFVTSAFEATAERRIMTPARLRQLLLAELADVDAPDLLPVRRYLLSDGSFDQRRAQLARTLTRIYDEYALCRPDMLARWASGQYEVYDDETPRWQAALWRRLRARAARLPGPPLCTLDEVLAAPAEIPAALFVFDVLLGTPILQGVLASWADRARIELYATNPCMEFWEDLPAGGRAARAVRAHLLPRTDARSAPLTDAEDPLPLVLWGRPGREHVRLVNQLTDCDFDGRFDTNPSDSMTVLRRLQHDILHRQPPISPRTAPDDSLVVHACPGARREAEVIVESIWQTVAHAAETDAPMSFSDIGIILAGRDEDAYRSHLAAVFEEYHEVPHHFLDVPVARASRIVEAVELLLALPASSFTRQDLLRLLTHPTVIPAEDSATVDEWVAWCRDLAIVHGADHDDHADTYIEDDLLNWDQGLSRLTLGLFMSSPPDGELCAYIAPSGRAYVPHEAPFDRAPSVAHLVTLARSLIADARFIAQAELSLAEWTTLLRLVLTAYLRPRDDADERDLLRVLSVLERMEDEAISQDRFGFTVVHEQVQVELEELRENVGQPLADGVVVAPLRLAASLPLRVVYLPGLHEGGFPVRDHQSSLDLRRLDRRPGEVTPRERDQYQFLTRLLATEDSVHLSYVARDPATGDPRAAAPTVVELMGILRDYLSDGSPSSLVKSHPLRRYAGPAHPFASVAAQREANARLLRSALIADLSARTARPTDGLELKALVGADLWPRLLANVGVHHPPPIPAGLPDTVTLRALRMFLEDPLQGWVHHTLGLRADEDDEDHLAVVDERFRTDRLSTHQLLRSALLTAVRQQRPVAEVYQAEADRLEIQGIVPTGMFKRADRQRHLTVLDGWQRALRRVFANRPRPFDPIRYGRGTTVAGATRIEPAVQLALADGPLEVRGTTLPAIADPAASVVLKVDARSSHATPTHELAGFIDHVVRSASDRPPEGEYAVWTVYGDGQVTRTCFGAFTPADAQAYLTSLVADLRSNTHDYLLPFSAIHRAASRADASDEGWEPILAAVSPARFGPLAGIETAPPEPQQAQDILTRRFDAFYRRRQPEDR